MEFFNLRTHQLLAVLVVLAMIFLIIAKYIIIQIAVIIFFISFLAQPTSHSVYSSELDLL